MCIAFWTLEHPDYALILCTNRDEFLDRPTLDARFHSFGRDGEGEVLSGIDVLGGGTWFGLTRAGRVALLTNITEPPPPRPFALSRGALVSAHLLSEPPAPRDAPFAGFNLLLLVPAPGGFDAEFVTNGGAGGVIARRPVERTGGFSNAVDEEWDKVVRGKTRFAEIVEGARGEEEEVVDELFGLLDEHPPEPVVHRSELKKAIHVLPLSIEGRMYGTRLSTVLLVRKNGEVLFVERDIWQLDHDGSATRAPPSSQRVYRFQVIL
ncbi:NRDE protein-domain-containing protein [Armillaria novae-zelandiae]|uniref:NRDE protein-domain-containing protein n=1 Tax=Armillaria novae-zelandiae TaxID=153914 RepID=A0AA39PPG8_9AGAR|nr:NRDE protein-domain-containing protein [Armillaria novae-zelandiae]